MSIVYAFLIIVILSISVALMFGLRKALLHIDWVEFYSMGKDAGFSFRDINLLRRVAVVNRYQKPSSLYWSEDVLDKSLAGISKKLEAESNAREKEYLELLLKKMYNYRQKVEFRKPRYNRGIESSYEIDLNQGLKIKIANQVIYESFVIENNMKYLVISYPKGPPLPVGFSWRDRILIVYFWRSNDAGYYFQARIMPGNPDRDFKTLRMTHSSVVIRSQKRRFVRNNCKMPGLLFPLKSLNTDVRQEGAKPGLRCFIQNISEDGAAILIGGHGKEKMLCKLQMNIYGQTVLVNGLVRHVSYDRLNNVSVLHFQSGGNGCENPEFNTVIHI